MAKQKNPPLCALHAFVKTGQLEKIFLFEKKNSHLARNFLQTGQKDSRGEYSFTDTYECMVTSLAPAVHFCINF